MTFDERRVRAALMKFDGDACREAVPAELAEYVLRVHLDIARCYCPACVLARALLDRRKENRTDYIEALWDFIDSYGWHDTVCPCHENDRPDVPCSCGFREQYPTLDRERETPST